MFKGELIELHAECLSQEYVKFKGGTLTLSEVHEISKRTNDNAIVFSPKVDNRPDPGDQYIGIIEVKVKQTDLNDFLSRENESIGIMLYRASLELGEDINPNEWLIVGDLHFAKYVLGITCPKCDAAERCTLH